LVRMLTPAPAEARFSNFAPRFFGCLHERGVMCG
jgi:hypothetical protein